MQNNPSILYGCQSIRDWDIVDKSPSPIWVKTTDRPEKKSLEKELEELKKRIAEIEFELSLIDD
jgi:hypothetical protein